MPNNDNASSNSLRIKNDRTYISDTTVIASWTFFGHSWLLRVHSITSGVSSVKASIRLIGRQCQFRYELAFGLYRTLTALVANLLSCLELFPFGLTHSGRRSKLFIGVYDRLRNIRPRVSFGRRCRDCAGRDSRTGTCT